MKLCRFELNSQPGQVHSGIFFENRLYETDGLNPIGVHELSSIRFLPPMGQAASIRCFWFDSEERLFYRYANSSKLLGQDCEWDVPSITKRLDCEVGVAMVITQAFEPEVSDNPLDTILGFCIAIEFVARDLEEEERSKKLCFTQSRDLGLALGPFLSTPDEVSGWSSGVTEKIILKVNNEIVEEVRASQIWPLTKMLECASRTRTLQPGEVLIAPYFSKLDLNKSNFKRWLQPSDVIQVSSENLGTLTLHLV